MASGPNQGFKYVASVTNSASYHYAILADLESDTSQFYLAQCGNYNPQTGTGFISGANLRANTIRHESGEVQSHWNNYRVAQNSAANNLGIEAERTTAPPTVAIGDFNSQNVPNALSPKQQAIGAATAVEPCGSDSTGYNASCVYQGPAKGGPPYAPCNWKELHNE